MGGCVREACCGCATVVNDRQVLILLVQVQELEVETERLHAIISVQADSLSSLELRVRAENNAAGSSPTPGV